MPLGKKIKFKISKIFNFKLVFLLGFSLQSCIIPALILERVFEPSYVDISNEPKLQHLMHRWLVLEQHMFLFQFSDTKQYALHTVGYWSSLPSSIPEYTRDPNNWQRTDYNAQRKMGIDNGYMKHKVLGVVSRGTKVYVEKVLEKRDYHSFFDVIGYLDDPRFSNIPVNITFLLDTEYHEIPKPNCPVNGRENYPVLKPGVISYCD